MEVNCEETAVVNTAARRYFIDSSSLKVDCEENGGCEYCGQEVFDQLNRKST